MLRLASSFLLLRLVCFIHLLRHLLLPSSLTRSPCWRQGPADIGVHFWLYLLFIDMMESQYSKLSAKTDAVDFALNPGLSTSADLSSISPNKTRHSRKDAARVHVRACHWHPSLVFFHSSPMWIQGLSLTSSAASLCHYSTTTGQSFIISNAVARHLSLNMIRMLDERKIQSTNPNFP